MLRTARVLWNSPEWSINGPNSNRGDLTLTSRIRNTNIDRRTFSFQFSYHTYLSVSDIRYEPLFNQFIPPLLSQVSIHILSTETSPRIWNWNCGPFLHDFPVMCSIYLYYACVIGIEPNLIMQNLSRSSWAAGEPLYYTFRVCLVGYQNVGGYANLFTKTLGSLE